MYIVKGVMASQTLKRNSPCPSLQIVVFLRANQSVFHCEGLVLNS